MHNGEPDWRAVAASIKTAWRTTSWHLDVGDVLGEIACDYYEGRIDEVTAHAIRRASLRAHRRMQYVGRRQKNSVRWLSRTRAEETSEPAIEIESVDVVGEVDGEHREYDPDAYVPSEPSHFAVFEIVHSLDRLGLLPWARRCAQGDREALCDFASHRRLAEALDRPQPNILVGRRKWRDTIDFFFTFSRTCKNQWLAIRHLSMISSIKPSVLIATMSSFAAFGIAAKSGDRKGTRYRFAHSVALEQALSVYRAVRREARWVTALDLSHLDLPGTVAYHGRAQHPEHVTLWLYVLAQCGHLEFRQPARINHRAEFHVIDWASDFAHRHDVELPTRPSKPRPH